MGGETMPTLIKKESLDRIFNDRSKIQHYEKGRCYCCGSEVSIIIDKLPGCYGLLGGVLYEEVKGKILFKCDHCLNDHEYKTQQLVTSG